MSKAWVVSSHGGKEEKGRFRRAISPTEKFKYGVTMIPPGMEMIMFTAQGKIFFGGDAELDALIAGNEDSAVITSRIHKKKGSFKIMPDYKAYGTTDFRSGVYEVGGGGTKAFDLPDGSETALSTILRRAVGHGVRRIYWLACTEFISS